MSVLLLLFLFVVTAAYLLITRERDTTSKVSPKPAPKTPARTEAGNA
jgi:hypothetical protein